MHAISMTDFADFVVKAGTPKLTKVRQVKQRGKYDPAADFWRTLREAIIEYHRTNSGRRGDLDKVATGLTDKKKVKRYPAVISSYKKFLGKKTCRWFEPPKMEWRSGALAIRVNPELGLQINGQRHVIKLYFKDDKPDKRKFDVVLTLMEDCLRSSLGTSDVLAILEMSTGQMFISLGIQSGLIPLLHGEAASFTAVWNRI